MRFCFLSNFAMLFPMYIAYLHGFVFTAGMVLACMLFSMFYHVDEDNDVGLLIDVFGVIVLTATLFYTLLQSTFVFTPLNLVSVLYAVAAIYCYMGAGEDTTSDCYNDFHAAWHVLAAYGLAAFIYSHANTQLLEYNPSRLSKPLLVKEEEDHFEAEVALLWRAVLNQGKRVLAAAPVRTRFDPVTDHGPKIGIKSETRGPTTPARRRGAGFPGRPATLGSLVRSAA